MKIFEREFVDEASFLEQMSEENEVNRLAYMEAHKGDPCGKCGATEELVVIPTGSLARLTLLCSRCADQMHWETVGYWRGYEDGARNIWRRSWWRRLFKR